MNKKTLLSIIVVGIIVFFGINYFGLISEPVFLEEKSIIDFIRNNGHAGLFILNSLDHTGTPIPLIAASMATKELGLSLGEILLIGVASGFIVDLIFYAIGLTISMMGLNLSLIEKKGVKSAQQMLIKNQRNVVFFGRFIPIVSRYIPFAAGLMNFKIQYFITYSFLGSIFYTCIYVLPFFYFGEMAKSYFGLGYAGTIILTFFGLVMISVLFKWRDK